MFSRIQHLMWRHSHTVGTTTKTIKNRSSMGSTNMRSGMGDSSSVPLSVRRGECLGSTAAVYRKSGGVCKADVEMPSSRQ